VADSKREENSKKFGGGGVYINNKALEKVNTNDLQRGGDENIYIVKTYSQETGLFQGDKKI